MSITFNYLIKLTFCVTNACAKNRGQSRLSNIEFCQQNIFHYRAPTSLPCSQLTPHLNHTQKHQLHHCLLIRMLQLYAFLNPYCQSMCCLYVGVCVRILRLNISETKG